MAGFKKSIQDMRPAGFYTFDGEAFNPTTRLLTGSPLVILDESDNQNDGLLMVGLQEPTKAYRAGMASLAPVEPANQQSMCFGYYGKVNGVWPKALVQIPHHAAMDTTANLGSFTVGFLYNKTKDEAYLRDAEYPALTYATLSKTLFYKPGMVRVTVIDPWNTSDLLRFVFPNGTIDVQQGAVTDFYGGTHFVVARWEVRPKAGGDGYTGVATVLINGSVMGTLSTDYADVVPVTTINLPAEVAGYSANDGNFDDRATTPIYLDQLAIWNRALKNVELLRLFKKVWEYNDMVLRKGPAIYLPLQDDIAVNNTEVFKTGYGSVGSVNAYTTGPVVRSRPGPPNVPGSRGFMFSRGLVQIRTTTWYGQPIGWLSWDSDNYAIEFWVNTGGTERAVLFSAQAADKPFSGPLVELNVGATGGFSNGTITFTESEQASVSTPSGEFINNGNWHHVVVQRREGKYLEIFVDGDLKASKQVSKSAGLNAWPNIMYAMGAAPGNLYCEGEMAHLAVFNGKTFSDFEAASRYQYAIIYRVRGNTTLRGVPYRARVRLYHYRTGELVDQMDSAATDGSFTFYLKDNSLVCSQILSMNDTNVRVRGFGPIAPSEIADSPITI